MSIVVALADGEATWLASDSLLTASIATWTLPDGKWLELPCGLWVGCAGTVRLQAIVEQLVEPSFDVPGLATAIRNAIRCDGWEPDLSPGNPPAYDCSMLIAGPGEVWELCANFALIPIPKGTLAAIGCGRQYAIGAAHATPSDHPHNVVKIAVQAAIDHDEECGRPVWSRMVIA